MKAPDVHKPRFRYNKFFDKIITEDLYNKWKKENPHIKHKINSYTSFKSYWNKIAGAIIKEVCSNPLGVKLPSYCGYLTIKYANIDLKPINKRASINNNMTVPHLNWNSNSKCGKLVWNTSKAAKYNALLAYYGFKGTRRFNQEVNKALLENPELFRTYSANLAESRYNLKLQLNDKQT